MKPRFDSLSDWLDWLYKRHSSVIKLGLERLHPVLEAMDMHPSPAKVVTIGGTNGKGSTVAMMQSVLLEHGQSVGSYTSPHLFRYNERIAINGRPVDDQDLIDAFTAIDATGAADQLSFFEIGTLAAFWLFKRANLDIWLLEVGLGGRLDAVNAIDSDIAVITSVGLDHQAWLGDSVEAIAAEKAGIMRAGKPVVCAQASPPINIVNRAKALSAPLFCLEDDFRYEDNCWRDTVSSIELPADLPFVRETVAGAVKALKLLEPDLPDAVLRRGLERATLKGRFERVDFKGVEIVFDVAHNPDAARKLAEKLRASERRGRSLALFAMMSDKDVAGVAKAMASEVDAWFLAPLEVNERAFKPEVVAKILHEQGINMISVSKNLKQAWRRSLSMLGDEGRLIVFGSFYTVAAVSEILSNDIRKSDTRRSGR